MNMMSSPGRGEPFDMAAEMDGLIMLWVDNGCPGIELHRPGHWGDLSRLGPRGDLDDIALAQFEERLRYDRDQIALDRIRRFGI